MASGPHLVQPGTVHSSMFRLSLRLGTGAGCVVMVGRRSGGGRREACESLRDKRGTLWLLCELCWRWWGAGREGFCVGVGEGAAGFAAGTGGLLWDEAALAALAAESALLMPATDWLEYPESLLTSALFGTGPLGVLSLPMSSGLDRLVRTFALPGEGSGV